MQLHEVVPFYAPVKGKRIGRGGKRGKTSGKGGKGQTARAGARPRPEMRDFIKKLPKLRGHGVNRARGVYADRPRPTVVNLRAIDSVYNDGEHVTPKTLASKGLIPLRGVSGVKILGSGDLTKKLSFGQCAVSVSVKEKIEKVGGSIL